MRGILLAVGLALAAGCGLGVGPYQPGREPFARAGTAAGDSEEEAREAVVPEAIGPPSHAYHMNGHVFAGVKQGVSYGRGLDGELGDGKYFFEMHGTVGHTLARDYLMIYGSLFAAGYNSKNEESGSLSYSAAGVELGGKLRVTPGLALHGAYAPMWGRVELETDDPAVSHKADGRGARVAAGFDWVFFRFSEADLGLTVEVQLVRSVEVDLGGMTKAFEGGAVAFELALVGF